MLGVNVSIKRKKTSQNDLLSIVPVFIKNYSSSQRTIVSLTRYYTISQEMMVFRIVPLFKVLWFFLLGSVPIVRELEFLEECRAIWHSFFYCCKQRRIMWQKYSF